MTKDIDARLERIEKLLERLTTSPRPMPGWVPTTPFPQSVPHTPNACPKCGLLFVDALGRPVTLGYVCSTAGCPTGLGGAAC